MTRDERWVLEEKYDGTPSPEFEADRRRLAEGEPAAYVIGHQPFLGLTIHLDSHPLIPRPETEWWAGQLLTFLCGSPVQKSGVGLGQAARSAPDFCTGDKPLRFLDLCAGSGAIGCAALASLPNARIYFSEIDPAHEATIRKNIIENNLDGVRADIRIGDLFGPFDDLIFDVIAANPPYIPELRELEMSVAKFEPALALYSGPDGLALIRRIAQELPKRLAPSGMAWIECDVSHSEEARDIFLKENLTATIRTDHYGVPRILEVSFP